MYSTSHYLLSGATSVSTGAASVLGMDKFSVIILSKNYASNIPPTGTINVAARLDPSSDYVNILTSKVSGAATGVLFQFNGPIESLRAEIYPITTGNYTVVARYSKYNK